ncbi:hypothetical protein ACTPEM_26085, partial [Clostridioides difficile]
AYLAAERISDEDIKKLKDISEEFKKSTLESDVDALLKLDVEFLLQKKEEIDAIKNFVIKDIILL